MYKKTLFSLILTIFIILNISNNIYAKDIKGKKVYYSGKAVVLTYHHISNERFSSITVTPERFEEDVKMLKENGFNIISLSQLLMAMEGKAKLPDNAVVITFDDGIESFYKYAYKVLKKYNVPATNFIITSRTESYRPSTKDFNPLSKEEIQEMVDSGLVEIHSHTHDSHSYVYKDSSLKKGGKLATRIYDPVKKQIESRNDYLDRIEKDLYKSKELIKNYTGKDTNVLCFPFGQYNSDAINVSKKVGFKYFVTTIYGVNKENTKTKYIYRIRAGEYKIITEKLKQDIIKCGIRE
ncbi:polysaccharide deacetylase family protein [Thermobrachium celere]|uniref:Polysaccharide deacetylase n=1 Tax=Thermobrachium celere DSM 8682 TaxID=941824 RepID=R7RQV8_9CLOT|nr:polysaccharide deacetylase family protein [Thermobrachium celere]CDF57736.1 Polysaccharide deacetylase [Thermobrachium celere DSM 8682]